MNDNSPSVVKELLKKLLFRFTSFGAPRYEYCIEPLQISLIVNEIERLNHTVGSIVEIGVARGMTSRLICQHLVSQGYKDQNFYCLDTFMSFTQRDLEFEIRARGKSKKELTGFGYNSFKVWKKNFQQFPFVHPVQADCSDFDFTLIAPIKFAFLDVDLYMPTAKSLPRIYDSLVPGGVIVVDDVLDKCSWDGAFQAYMEFCRINNIEPKIVGNKCGVIYKTSAQPSRECRQ